MKKNPVSFFEVPAADFKKAKEFYERVFDWNVELWGDEGAMALTTAADKDHNPIEPGGINGAPGFRHGHRRRGHGLARGHLRTTAQGDDRQPQQAGKNHFSGIHWRGTTGITLSLVQ